MSVIDAIIAKKLCGGGGGSVPKPLTYDYMPEGYPKKSVQTTTLMAEQEVAFEDDKNIYYGHLANAFDIVIGQTYKVNWDGTEYECIGSAYNEKNISFIGNLSISGVGNDTGEPFLYVPAGSGFNTLDTSASHTISVKTTVETVTPLTYDYMPEGYPKKSVQTTTLMEEQELAFRFVSDGGVGLYMAQLTNILEIVAGQTYAVNWDGTEYECVGSAIQKSLTLGNLSIMNAGGDTGEPFLYIYNISESRCQFITSDASASHTISVKTTMETVTPMAAEFLPSAVNELIMNSSTTNSTKKFKITVDDSGTISATEVT